MKDKVSKPVKGFHGTAGQGFRQAARDLGVFARSRCIETSCFKGSLLTTLISGNPGHF